MYALGMVKGVDYLWTTCKKLYFKFYFLQRQT